jgi:hypothetical protein
MVGNEVPPGPNHTFMCPAGIPRDLFPANEMAAVGTASLPESRANLPSDV